MKVVKRVLCILLALVLLLGTAVSVLGFDSLDDQPVQIADEEVTFQLPEVDQAIHRLESEELSQPELAEFLPIEEREEVAISPTEIAIPTIIRQPLSSVTVLGESATFTIEVAGCPAPRILWRRISSAGWECMGEGAVLTVHNVTSAMEGDEFYAAVYNEIGWVNSEVVRLWTATHPHNRIWLRPDVHLPSIPQYRWQRAGYRVDSNGQLPDSIHDYTGQNRQFLYWFCLDTGERYENHTVMPNREVTLVARWRVVTVHFLCWRYTQWEHIAPSQTVPWGTTVGEMSFLPPFGKGQW